MTISRLAEPLAGCLRHLNGKPRRFAASGLVIIWPESGGSKPKPTHIRLTDRRPIQGSAH